MLDLIQGNIPERLKKKKQWVAIKVTADGRKMPINPKPEAKGKAASISDSATWGSFEQAVALVVSGKYDAIAYALTKGDRLIFIDLDCHLDKCNSEEEKEALMKKYRSLFKVLSYFDTYFEKSLSGTGAHLIAQGELDEELKTGSSPLMPLEIYTEKKFVIFTGHKLNDFDIEDNERTIGAIRNLHKNYFQKKSVSAGKTGSTTGNQKSVAVLDSEIYTDEQVLKNACKDKEFELLWNGHWDQVIDSEGKQKFTQQHFSDFQLVRKLAFYTGNCKTQIERLFRQSPCYQQYGKDGKWTKYESDIRTDIEKATSTCWAVYNPSSYKKDWKPDYHAIYASLTDTDESKRPFRNPKLISILKDYINKYADKNVAYLPYLFKEDRNINGATSIVKKVTGNKLKYSSNFSSYFRWNGKKFVNYDDADMLIHPLTEILELVEHSVFYWTMTYVAEMEDTDSTEDTDSKEKSPKELMEELAVQRFADSKRYVSAKLAHDVLKKLKGMDINDDIVKYYDTPYINMQNGVLNLLTRELTEHAPEYNLHKLTNCNYDPEAKCPEFLAMVERLMPGEAERRELQKAFGLCLAKEHLPAKKVLLLMVGPTDTGKSTFLNVMSDVLGEYATAVDNSVLMQNSKDKSRGPEMYAFFEHLLITSSETNESDRLDVAKIKSLTGETMQSIRNNYATKMDQFRMTGLIAIDSNYHPYIPVRDTASWNRLRMFPFVQTVKKKDPTLKKKLEAERDGIFNWLLEGLDMILEDKAIFETQAMLDYKEQYKKDMDTTAQFLKDCIVQAGDAAMRIPTTLVFTTYKNWCSENGFTPIVRNKFYEEIGKVYERKKSGSEYYAGMKFTELGSLYCTMKEHTPQDFAKKKRAIIEGYKMDLPYHVVRKFYYDKSKGWFHRVNEDTKREHYIDYCSWCAENGLIPIGVNDFMAKVNYLKKYVDGNYIARNHIENAKDVWDDRY